MWPIYSLALSLIRQCLFNFVSHIGYLHGRNLPSVCQYVYVSSLRSIIYTPKPRFSTPVQIARQRYELGLQINRS